MDMAFDHALPSHLVGQMVNVETCEYSTRKPAWISTTRSHSAQPGALTSCMTEFGSCVLGKNKRGPV